MDCLIEEFGLVIVQVASPIFRGKGFDFDVSPFMKDADHADAKFLKLFTFFPKVDGFFSAQDWRSQKHIARRRREVSGGGRNMGENVSSNYRLTASWTA